MIGPPVKLSVLRDIGWTLWDPIGLYRGDWESDPGADEYDRYLLQAVGLIRRGGGVPVAIDYLIEIETKHIGLGNRTTRKRATATAEAIKRYLDGLPAPQG